MGRRWYIVHGYPLRSFAKVASTNVAGQSGSVEMAPTITAEGISAPAGVKRPPFRTLIEHALSHGVLIAILALLFILNAVAANQIILPRDPPNRLTAWIRAVLDTLPFLERALLGLTGIILLILIVVTIGALVCQAIRSLWRRPSTNSHAVPPSSTRIIEGCPTPPNGGELPSSRQDRGA